MDQQTLKRVVIRGIRRAYPNCLYLSDSTVDCIAESILAELRLENRNLSKPLT